MAIAGHWVWREYRLDYGAQEGAMFKSHMLRCPWKVHKVADGAAKCVVLRNDVEAPFLSHGPLGGVDDETKQAIRGCSMLLRISVTPRLLVYTLPCSHLSASFLCE